MSTKSASLISFYIDYNGLKKSIKNLRNSRKSNGTADHFLTSGDDSVSENQNPLDSILKSSIGSYVNKFIFVLEKEINRFYEHYLKIEREIYDDLNQQINSQGTFKQLTN